MNDSGKIPVDFATAQLLSECGEVLIRVVRSKFGCRTVLRNIGIAGRPESDRKVAMTQEKRYSIKLSGLEISVWKDDLTTHQVDAVVNAANEDLHHGAGLAGALVRVGGKDIQRWSDEIIKNHGKMDNVTLHIKQGNIELEKVDVIVNTVSPGLRLSEGAISKAILKKAGHRIQSEINRHYGTEFGDVIETQGYDLDCSYVYHTVCAPKTVVNSAKILLSVLSKCLDKAARSKHTSISFPAIGTGNLDFSKQEVAKIMMRAVSDFAEKYQGKKMDVSFVLYPSEANTLKAFEKEMHSLEDATISSPNKGSYENNGATNEAVACIELYSNSTENRREATRWIYSILLLMRESYTITNNHIQHFGLREHEELLSLQTMWKVSIGEFLRDGSAGVIITGPREGVKGAVLAVEALCCQAQEEFARAEENAMLHTLVRWRCVDIPELEEPENSGALERAYLAGSNTETLKLNGSEIEVNLKKLEAKILSGMSYRIERSVFKDYSLKFQRTVINPQSTDQKDRLHSFSGLNIIKIEKVQNPLLEYHFKLKQKQVSDRPKCLYQRVPAQFCDLVCRVGFQRFYSPPQDQKYGAGIYFSHSVDTARKQAEHLCQEEEYIYIFEAQVLTGKATVGSPDLIVPPALGRDPFSLYDSVKGDTDTRVIFNSHQALPIYLITCK
ncbi:hypothetical protein MATL_G00154510 [Megalops atlanticus]|uniref:Poly [ADP-ribose] polymerase n=1 Tax=Megalops atlanticus TaxID=7932 RepID=A0A9D3PSR6_MEGAT|nr:hypothetical protein MATL_G00154510 [Megalops atlanticus]